MIQQRGEPLAGIVEDWTNAKLRWQAWWQCEIHDRVLIAVTAPKDGVAPPQIPPVDPQTQWTDADFMVRRALETVRTTYYGGEALPSCMNPVSVGFAPLVGCQPHYTDGAMWGDPAPAGPDGHPALDVWRASPWRDWMLATTRTFVANSHGRYFTIPFWGNHAGDELAAVCGIEQLMIDMANDPGWVAGAVKQMSDAMIELQESYWQCVLPEVTGMEGSLNHEQCWSPARTRVFDCDVSCMVSARAYREVFLPPLLETMQYVDHRVYHLDGPGALHHLDTLLGVRELHAIQWQPGAGHNQSILDWLPVIRRVQAAHKAIVLDVLDPKEIDALLQEVSPEGVYLRTTCPSESEARRLVEHLARRPQKGGRR